MIASDRPTSWRRDLAVLIAVTLVTRLCAAAFSVTPARDMVRYIEAAKVVDRFPAIDAVRQIDCHPLYPAIILTTKRALDLADRSDAPESWVRAGTAASIVGYTLFIGAAYFLGRRAFGGWVAFWGCLLVALLPRQISYSVDILTDGWHALFWMLALHGLATVGSAQAVWAFAGAGLASGLAYLTRAEALLLPVVAASGLAALQTLRSQRLPWARLNRLAFAFALAFAIPAGTYAAVIGRLSPRNSASAMLGLPTAAEPRTPIPERLTHVAGTPAAPQPPSAAEPVERLELNRPWTQDESYEYRSLGKATVAYLYEIAQETRVWLLPFVLWGLLLLPRYPGAFAATWFTTIAWLGYAAVLVGLQIKCGYIAGRYLMPMLPSLGFLAALGMRSAWRSIARPTPWLIALTPRQRQRALVGVLAVTALGANAPALFRSNHRHRHAYVDAVRWLKEHTPAGEAVFDPSQLVSFLADRPTWRPRHPREPIPVRYAVVDVDRVYRTDSASHAVIKRFNEFGRPVAKFVEPNSRRKGVMYVFELPPDRSARLPTTGARR
jgi:hypothetical protein